MFDSGIIENGPNEAEVKELDSYEGQNTPFAIELTTSNSLKSFISNTRVSRKKNYVLEAASTDDSNSEKPLDAEINAIAIDHPSSACDEKWEPEQYPDRFMRP